MTEDRLTILYKTYGPAISIRCRSILSDEAEAHDATQETFVRVYRHLSEVPSDREALYWIYRVATNFCLNELRNRRGRPPQGEARGMALSRRRNGSGGGRVHSGSVAPDGCHPLGRLRDHGAEALTQE
jgi:RNA polymerase sigma-70 factor (ECF subfamily)